MKAVVAAFNQEKALVGAFSVITNLQMELFEALVEVVLSSKRTASTQQVVELQDLGPGLALQMITALMEARGRRINNFQNRLILNALEHCSLPLFCKLIVAEVTKWRSYANPR